MIRDRICTRLAFVLLVTGIAMITGAGSVGATGVELASAEQRTTLLELYTSEGCSSCPPADEWLGTLKNAPQLWRDIVPVAFHVDYWDQLGWPDRYARREHTARQQRYAVVGRVDTVYTPGFVVNGREWRQWFSRRTLPAPSGEIVGVLRVRIDDNTLSAQYAPAVARHDVLQLHLAWLASNVSTDVKAGENRSRTLHHEFVAMNWAAVASTAASDATGLSYRWNAALAEPPPEAAAVAAWISRVDDPAPIQAVGGWHRPVSDKASSLKMP